MSDKQTYPNAGPAADLGRYRTGETPMVGDVVRLHGDCINGVRDEWPTCQLTIQRVYRSGEVEFPVPHRSIEKRALYADAARFDLISRAVVPLADSPDAGKMVDWTEDFQHENGRYFVVCGQCGVQFLGHKRRHYCKRCSAERQTVSASEAEPAPEPTLLEAAERVVWGIYRNGKLADVALTRSAMEYETEYAIGYRSNTAQAMLLCKASPEQIAAVERAKGGG